MQTTAKMKKRWLTENEVAALIRRSVSSLRRDRMLGIGLPYCKWPGQRLIRYDEEAVFEFMDRHTVHPRHHAAGSPKTMKEAKDESLGRKGVMSS